MADLNPEQRAAVEALDGPVLVLAGAGTGKTRVLTTRIAHILCSGRARGSQVLAVTFTNKAAREMKERIGALVGGAVEGMPWLGTFHAIGVKILRRHAELVGLKSGFTILDADDQVRLVKQVIESEGLDKDRWPGRQLAALIDGWKNRGLTPDKVPRGEAFAFAEGKGAQLYAAYQKRLKELNAADFGDLLLEVLRLFLENPDVLKDYQSRFRYMLVDEYQDTNVAQYLWLRLLAGGWPGPTSAASATTTSRSTAGAAPRSTTSCASRRTSRAPPSSGWSATIARPAISWGPPRGSSPTTRAGSARRSSPTTPWASACRWPACGTTRRRPAPSATTSRPCARRAHALTRWRSWCGHPSRCGPSKTASSRSGLPYRVIGGPRFYERQEIKDAIAYLEVTLNPANDLKFERIINVPKRGLGDTAVRRVTELARARGGVPLYQAAREIVETEELTGKARKSLADLIAAFERWRGQIEGMKHTELAELILDESGYTQMWQQDKSPQAHARLENLKELIRFMHEFESLQGFLEHVSLVMDVDTADGEDRVSLMTLHAAKGLEFDVVFLPGWEEGLFPHQRSLDESGAGGPGGGAAAGLRRPHARQAQGQGELCPEPAQPRPVAGGSAVALRR